MSSLEWGDNMPENRDEDIYDRIVLEGFQARNRGMLPMDNPYSRIACQIDEVEYDRMKEESWMAGWSEGGPTNTSIKKPNK